MTLTANHSGDTQRLASEHEMAEINRCLESGDLDRAYRVAKTLLNSGCLHLSLLNLAGVLAAQLSDYQSARHHFAAALEFAPDNYEARYNLALVEIASSQTAAARNHLRLLLAGASEPASILNDIAVTWEMEGRPSRALASYGRAMRLDPENSRVRNNALRYCLECAQPATGLKLVERQDNSEQLSARSEAEIHRWKAVLSERLTTVE